MLSEYWLTHLVVVIAAGKRPASIPNLEAKPASADGTAPGRVWESRTPPQHTSQMVGPLEHTFQGPTLYIYPQEKQKKGQPTGPVLQPKGRPPFLRKHFLLQHSTRQHTPRCERTPRIRTQRCDSRKRARLVCNRTGTIRNTASIYPIHSLAHSASAFLVASS